ncbi:tubby-like F-box protein 5 [Malus sylvestris]|uniref:tubby-like F-box protein 5 n=1 Tax=Malus sylvestris TaxID=3752 RepID=UPI0021ACD2DC|nr:tubby-like F-box protein 5 [Malus sylvestris]XP_050160168.1 tubby-like F-box protein 5 [Malus sylvestris]XP_050160169.1 tubby-like F-box protein 5 [Malus sylvestris]XP_050160170.1 tubby-like F-box protein 5 [Malus sylvestris]XP_050160171.1 tubby-like F-box protein 5 [Malus sylvestris]XP_050160172.1 tubby-like F-box protein 5 [Malus sylvestris]
MQFKNVFHELLEMRDDKGKKSRRGGEERKHTRRRAKSHIAPEHTLSSPASVEQSKWANLPPELLLDIIQRVEASETSWPARRDVIACASVCKSWREITKEIVKTPEQCGWLTFPVSLKQPGPRDHPIQCFIKRERETSTYLLYLGLSPALCGDVSKLLLAARKVRRAASTHFVVSLAADEFSRASNSYVGKLRSNFLGSKFTVYDSQPPQGSAIQTNYWSHRKMNSKTVSPRIPAGSYSVATVCYELNILRTRGPRRMQCIMQSIPVSAVQEGGVAPTPTELATCLPPKCCPMHVSKGSKQLANLCSSVPTTDLEQGTKNPLILKNKAPRWHEQLQCWCLNFKGRVTVASVKNFQLVAGVEPCHNVPLAEQERVILQFGKIGKDIFTMDYRYPLSAFQAFAVCLSSFDTKPACE